MLCPEAEILKRLHKKLKEIWPFDVEYVEDIEDDITQSTAIFLKLRSNDLKEDPLWAYVGINDGTIELVNKVIRFGPFGCLEFIDTLSLEFIQKTTFKTESMFEYYMKEELKSEAERRAWMKEQIEKLDD